QLDDCAGEVCDFVDGLDGVCYLPIDDRVNVYGHVVARNHGLRRKVYVLLAQVNRDQSGPHVRPVDAARLVEERNDDVQAAPRNAAEATQTLDEHDGRLRHDLYSLGGDDERGQRDEHEEDHDEDVHKTSNGARTWAGM